MRWMVHRKADEAKVSDSQRRVSDRRVSQSRGCDDDSQTETKRDMIRDERDGSEVIRGISSE